MMPDPQIRTTTRNRNRPRRLSACHRHPSEPVTGFCALCLRDRLAGLDSSAAEAQVEKVAVCSRRTRGHAGASSSTAAPGLRRSKSVAAEKGESLNGLVVDQRRKSCDVRGRSTLSDLFVVDDTKKGGGGVARVESRNLGFSSFAEPVLETKEDEEDDDEEEHDDDDDDDDNEIRVSGDVFVRNEVDDDGDIEDGDLKTMKEFIDIELQNKRRNFWEAASVFSQKLRKWRQKQKQKKQNRDCNGGTDIDRSKLGQFRDTQSEVADYGLGRRSCDTEPRFSIDAHRLSVEDPRFSFDEHRSSWDGYMIARTIPRLTPMLSIVDSMIIPPPVNRGTITTMENLQMHSISEDGASSGQSNSNSDASTSNRGSSSSSMKSFSTKTTGLGGDEVKSSSNARVSPANDVVFQGTKLVITENELKDWHLKSTKNSNIASVSVSNTPISTTVNNSSNMHKKAMPSKWRKVCNLWSHKKNLEEIPENVNSNPKLDRNTNSMNSRNFVLDRNRSTRYSTSDLDNNGLLRLYLTPFRNSTRRSKSGKSSSKGRNMSPSMASNNFQLN